MILFLYSIGLSQHAGGKRVRDLVYEITVETDWNTSWKKFAQRLSNISESDEGLIKVLLLCLLQPGEKDEIFSTMDTKGWNKNNFTLFFCEYSMVNVKWKSNDAFMSCLIDDL